MFCLNSIVKKYSLVISYETTSHLCFRLKYPVARREQEKPKSKKPTSYKKAMCASGSWKMVKGKPGTQQTLLIIFGALSRGFPHFGHLFGAHIFVMSVT